MIALLGGSASKAAWNIRRLVNYGTIVLAKITNYHRQKTQCQKIQHQSV